MFSRSLERSVFSPIHPDDFHLSYAVSTRNCQVMKPLMLRCAKEGRESEDLEKEGGWRSAAPIRMSIRRIRQILLDAGFRRTAESLMEELMDKWDWRNNGTGARVCDKEYRRRTWNHSGQTGTESVKTVARDVPKSATSRPGIARNLKRHNSREGVRCCKKLTSQIADAAIPVKIGAQEKQASSKSVSPATKKRKLVWRKKDPGNRVLEVDGIVTQNASTIEPALVSVKAVEAGPSVSCSGGGTRTHLEEVVATGSKDDGGAVEPEEEVKDAVGPVAVAPLEKAAAVDPVVEVPRKADAKDSKADVADTKSVVAEPTRSISSPEERLSIVNAEPVIMKDEKELVSEERMERVTHRERDVEASTPGVRSIDAVTGEKRQTRGFGVSAVLGKLGLKDRVCADAIKTYNLAFGAERLERMVKTVKKVAKSIVPPKVRKDTAKKRAEPWRCLMCWQELEICRCDDFSSDSD